MSKIKPEEKPEVYAVQQDGSSWHISRRDFLKAAGLGTAVAGMGLHTRFVKPVQGDSGLENLCKSSPSHKNAINELILSADGKYLISCDTSSDAKCWDFSSHALSEKREIKSGGFDCTAILSGKSVLITHLESKIMSVVIPALTDGPISSAVTVGSGSPIRKLAVDMNGDIYGISSNIIFQMKNNSGKYENPEILEKLQDSSNQYTNISILSPERFLFIMKQSGFSIVDIRSGKVTDHDSSIKYDAYAVLPGGARALLCEQNKKSYRLVSLTDGTVIWEKETNDLLYRAAVTPDGAYGIIAAESKIFLMSMKDGAEIHSISGKITGDTKIAVSKDGTQFAFNLEKSILFVSLPDFTVIGCPVDLEEMKDDTKGIEVKKTDPKTGRTETYTLPCGAPIPEGAVCVCNCVAGKVCSCDGYVACSCDTYTYCSCDTVCSCVGNTYCSCDTVCTCDAESGHYWYPD